MFWAVLILSVALAIVVVSYEVNRWDILADLQNQKEARWRAVDAARRQAAAAQVETERVESDRIGLRAENNRLARDVSRLAEELVRLQAVQPTSQ